MKKTNPQNFIIELHVYPFDIMFSIGETDEQLKQSLSKYDIPETEFDCFEMGKHTNGTTCHSRETHRTIVRLKEVPVTNKGMGVLAHEIFHAVDMILRDIQIRLSADSDEAYAYCIDYVTEQFWNHIKPGK